MTRVYTVPYGGRRLDHIARDTMQTERNGTVTALLDANTGLAALVALSEDGLVPADTVIAIPEYRPPEAEFVLAWR